MNDQTITCNTIGCHCPSASGKHAKYTFTYICNKRNIIYYDVPKAGSTTIRKLLFPQSWPFGKTPCYNSITEKIDPDKKYKTFTFVRNPFSKMVSAWKHFISKPYHIKQLKDSGVDLSTCEDFSGFVEMTEKLQNHHWQPQTNFVPESVDYVGKLENFQQDFDNVCELIGIDTIQLPVKNSTEHAHYTTYYNDELIQRVSEIYSDDLIRFNYKF